MHLINDLVTRIVNALEAGDLDAFAACFSPEAVQHHSFFPTPNAGRPAIRDAEALFSMYSDVNVEAATVIPGDPWSAIEWRVRARNTGPIAMFDDFELPATGRTVQLLRADPPARRALPPACGALPPFWSANSRAIQRRFVGWTHNSCVSARASSLLRGSQLAGTLRTCLIRRGR